MGEIASRFLEMALYQNAPLQANLSGLELDMQLYRYIVRRKGRLEAEIGFNVGARNPGYWFPVIRCTFYLKASRQ